MNGNKTEKKNVFKRFLLLTPLGNGTAEEALLLWLIISVWVHYVASGVIMVAVFAATVFNPEMRKRIKREKNFFILGAVIGLYSFTVSAIAKNLIGLAISFGVFLVITLGALAKTVMTEQLLQKISVICAIGSVISAVLAVYQNFFKYGYQPLYRPTAVAFNANYYGALIVMTMIICIYHVLDGKKAQGRAWFTPNRLFYAVVFLVNLALLMISESRSSLMAFMFCAVFYLLITRRYFCFAVALCVFAVVVILGWFFPDLFSWTNSLAFSFTERVGIWKEALKSFSQSPYTAILGRGPMTYYLVKAEEGLFDAMHAHNLFFDFLINVGIIGTAVYCVIFVYFIKEIFRVFKSGDKMKFVLSSLFVLELLSQGIADVTIMWHQCATLFILGFSVVGEEKPLENAEQVGIGE